MGEALDFKSIVSAFESQLCYSVHFRINTVGKVLYSHSNTIINRHRKTSLEKIIIPLTLFVRVRKSCGGFYCERELGTKHNCNNLTPTLMAVSVVSFSFSWCPTWGPGAHSAWWWLSLLHLISNFSQLNRGPRAPSAWCGFPNHISSITPSDL